MPITFEELIDRVIASNVPILLPDTCILLDLVRSPRRTEVTIGAITAARRLVKAITIDQTVACILIDQVHDELIRNRPDIEEDADKGVNKLEGELHRRADWTIGQEIPADVDVAHVRAGVLRARILLDDWILAALKVDSTEDHRARAGLRVGKARAPSRRGRDSYADCLIVEASIAIARALRSKGYKHTIMFASSNLEDFYDRSTRGLYDDLAKDFGEDGIEIKYARNLEEAAYRLELW